MGQCQQWETTAVSCVPRALFCEGSACLFTLRVMRSREPARSSLRSTACSSYRPLFRSVSYSINQTATRAADICYNVVVVVSIPHTTMHTSSHLFKTRSLYGVLEVRCYREVDRLFGLE